MEASGDAECRIIRYSAAPTMREQTVLALCQSTEDPLVACVVTASDQQWYAWQSVLKCTSKITVQTMTGSAMVRWVVGRDLDALTAKFKWTVRTTRAPPRVPPPSPLQRVN